MTATYPGVHVGTLPGSARAIELAATGVAAFVGGFRRGSISHAVRVTSRRDVERTFGAAGGPAETGCAVAGFFDNGGSAAWLVRVDDGGVAASAVLRDDAGGVAFAVTAGRSIGDAAARDPGAWGNALSLGIVRRADDSFDLTVSETGAAFETYRGLTAGAAAATVNAVSALIRLEAGTEAPPVAATVALSGGSDGAAPGAAALIGTAHARSGLYALDGVTFDILCMPDAAAVDDAGACWAQAIGIARERGAMAIVDPPVAAATPADIAAWLAARPALRDANAALYFPRLRVAAGDGAVRSIGASGAMAAVWARTDAARGVWRAPAGRDADLRGIVGLARVLTDDDNGILNPLGINCLRTLPALGTVAWGARTLAGADALGSTWKYVPVRRLASAIEASVRSGLGWAVFEPDGEPLWAALRQSVGTFMNGLFRQGAFEGATPDEAYFVRCDASTHTTADISAGIVTISIGFAPLKPARVRRGDDRLDDRSGAVTQPMALAALGGTIEAAGEMPERLPAALRPIVAAVREGSAAVSVLIVGAEGPAAGRGLAAALGRPLYRIGLGRIAAGQMTAAGAKLGTLIAGAGGAVLLFDEAEALFGKRGEIRDAHDRYADVVGTTLAGHLERARGPVLFAAAAKAALDPGFVRRLRFVIEMLPPVSASA